MSENELSEEERQEEKEGEVTIHYLRPGYEIIHPDEIEKRGVELPSAVPSLHHKLYKMSSDFAVKRENYDLWGEAQNMLFVEQHSTIPVQKVYAVYSCLRTVEFYGTICKLEMYYILMEFKPGVSVDTAWSRWDLATINNVKNELRDYMCQLRNIPGGDYIGRLNRLPLITGYGDFGPFDSEDAYNIAISERFGEKMKKYEGRAKERMYGMLSVHKHKIVFTHARFQPGNILVHDGHVSAIVNWGMAAWYPDYKEYYVSIIHSCPRDDWNGIVDHALAPIPYCERFLQRRIWAVIHDNRP